MESSFARPRTTSEKTHAQFPSLVDANPQDSFLTPDRKQAKENKNCFSELQLLNRSLYRRFNKNNE